LEQNARLISWRKVLHMPSVGIGCLCQLRLDFALHLPVNLMAGIVLPSIDASSAMVITRSHFLHKLAFWSCRLVTFGSWHSVSMIDWSSSRWSFGYHWSLIRVWKKLAELIKQLTFLIFWPQL
jgi:hypothetical protein